jgi:hypothetical protein
MGDLACRIQKACSALGLRVELGFTTCFGDGQEIHSVAHIPELGGPNGMLVVASAAEIKKCEEHLQNYGFSVMSDSNRDDFDLDSWRLVFIDWGWHGDTARKPRWMTEPPLEELKDILLDSPDEESSEDAVRKICLIHWENDQAQRVLFDLIQSGALTGSLLETCIDALTYVWTRRGAVYRGLFDQMDDERLMQILAAWFRELAQAT